MDDHFQTELVGVLNLERQLLKGQFFVDQARDLFSVGLDDGLDVDRGGQVVEGFDQAGILRDPGVKILGLGLVFERLFSNHLRKYFVLQ